MTYLNVMDKDFDTQLFTPHELEELELNINSKIGRMVQLLSLKMPSSHREFINHYEQRPSLSSSNSSMSSYGSYGSIISIKLTHLNTTQSLRYHPPPVEKCHIFLVDNKIPSRPEYPLCQTNTAIYNYMHKMFIYENYLLNQLSRQRSYHLKYRQGPQVSLKHQYNRQLSNQISRSISKKSCSKISV